jgi:hypothetical protein
MSGFFYYLLLLKASAYVNGILTPNWNDVEPSSQLLINTGMIINDVKFFHQLRDPKKFTENRLNDEGVQQFANTPAVEQVL